MDAAEHDLDAKLYKASGSLLLEIQRKLPLLIFNPLNPSGSPRVCVLDSKCYEVRLLLDRFQEWPQLLDPCLSNFVQLLAGAFVGYLTTASHHYGPSRRHGTTTVSPLPRAICQLLYTFCKVRGNKVIVRLLNSEPKYLGPMLSAFKAWKTPALGMTWEERYVILLWLSHLMLAPFELANMSIRTDDQPDLDISHALGNLPGIASDVVSLAFGQLGSSGKERDASSILLVRLCLRNDMRTHDLPLKLINHATQRLLSGDELVSVNPYRSLGFLSLIHGITNSGSDSEVGPYLEKLFQSMLEVATSPSSHFIGVRDSAPARKSILKILRVILTHAISLNSSKPVIAEGNLNMMLEESIQYYLDALSDKDTPVRMAAAKSLSVIALKLEPAMSAEVVEAVLACLQENVLLEDRHTQKLVAITDKVKNDGAALKRNISAVDPLRWHGLMLTLAHLLFRRSPPPNILLEIIQALILGLEFEQRSNVGTSIGVGVRDAACFGLWALARKYSSAELELVQISELTETKSGEFSKSASVLQLLAVKLTISACLDPSGNIRRGSSAALQELIGRHPDTILHGIAIVQIVDYHAVARLSRAMTEVSPQAASLSPVYRRTLLQALIEWRGARATDVNQRRWAATTIRTLTKFLPDSDTIAFVRIILNQLLDLKYVNIGSTAGARHGLLLALASALESMTENDAATTLSWLSEEENPILALSKLTGKMDGRVTADLELVLEAISTLIGRICRCFSLMPAANTTLQRRLIPSALDILSQCTVAAGRDIVVQASADAVVELFKLLPNPDDTKLVENWLDSKEQPPSVFTSKGRIKALSLIHAYLARVARQYELRESITSYAIKIVEGNFKIETRVDAMEALAVILPTVEASTQTDASRISAVLRCGLTDYTNDQRGDIGSILRLQSLETVDAFRGSKDPHQILDPVRRTILPPVVKLAAEKLNNVRFRAWKCLESYWRTSLRFPALKSTFHYPADVSSVAYFRQLMELLCVEWAQKDLLLGIVSSATSGTEDTCRAACNAYVLNMQSLDNDERQKLTTTVSSILVEQLGLSAAQEDRQVVPLLDFITFMIDQGLWCSEPIMQSRDRGLDIWDVMQTVHTASSTLQRIEASLNLYSRLLTIDGFRARAMDKLTRQLLHRWPKVIRNSAADLLYLDTPTPILASCDWNSPVTKIKPVVLELRKQLGVAGNAAPKS
ncbi:uncharacterized protein Z518_03219 [Rhinocladiella mackenziei CBS 650.93]|uniref:Rhinocladiella mackenziei CBS 650.93 unplaced genomic scaffold supercont1.2, whole genome shotgun sequence n=1 Tax=Rhinocladiella mackenziei CBS 650.93 TaxID=1442369 RepID=A0A0D2HDH4_9EURO|nr:uncharacterized protein Z518_03219 [Rhinocladiella mackenziei CBS 650.93]KIX08563.1 hypothetical protein Z518_03219 [Rhinocladiella mackenziei CBS 650.93]